jgi:hypothetical protein
MQLKLAESADTAGVRLDWLGLPELGLKVDPEAHKVIP